MISRVNRKTKDARTPASSRTTESEIPIEDYICLALYTASRAVTGVYRDLLAEADLTYPQYLVMRLLWQRGTLPVKDIAATLSLDYGTLSPLLKRLQARGLIRRERRSDDERSVDISLTDSGDALRAKADRVPTELTCALALDPPAIDELRSTLRRLTDAVTAATA